MYQSVQPGRRETSGDKNRDWPAQFCDNAGRTSGPAMLGNLTADSSRHHTSVNAVGLLAARGVLG
jgi:hypothetical protein